MRLSIQTDYALRTLMFLAAHEGQYSIADIAKEYAISKNHLMKVAQKLAAEGFIKSVRGRGGGLKLARPANELNVGAIVRIMEDMNSFVECFDATTNQCIVRPECGLRHALAGAVEAFQKHLDQFTIASLIGNRQRFTALFENTD